MLDLTDRQEELLRVGVGTYFEVHCIKLEDSLARSDELLRQSRALLADLNAQVGKRCYRAAGRLILPELGYGQDEGGWWIRPPGCQQTPLGHNHVTEYPDGSITVRIDIATPSWAGRLDRGRWISS
jgi:hypothetical protein